MRQWRSRSLRQEQAKPEVTSKHGFREQKEHHCRAIQVYAPGERKLSITSDLKDEMKHSVSVLNGLIETCKDGEKGFAAASEKAKEASLKTLFAKYAAQRAGFVAELQFAVTELGGDAAESGHLAASLHRGWISVKEAVSPDSDKALVDECESGEDAAMKNYEEAAKEMLPAAVKSLIGKQFIGVREAHGTVRDLKHAMA